MSAPGSTDGPSNDAPTTAPVPVVGLPPDSALYGLLVQSVKDYAIFMLDPTGHVASWNAGAERIKGYAAHEIIGQHFSRFYPAEDQDKPMWELDVAVAEGRFEDEGWRLRKDGTRFWANVIITPLFDRQGVLVGFAKVTRDLTERRRSEERAIIDASRVAAADAANRAKSDFLATMSHELRTPLNAIGGYADLIETGVGGPVTEVQRDFLGRIRAAQHHLLSIINDLLNYSRIEAGQVAYDMRRLSLESLLARGIHMVAPQAVRKGIELVHDHCRQDVMAVADEQKVEQIVLNLLSNAVKFTPSGGRVVVGCDVIAGRPVIRVSDTGPGIPRDQWEAVFEPFVQLGRSLAAPQQGTGLGLAISRDLARAMDGDLELESTPGEGATFTLTLRAG